MTRWRTLLLLAIFAALAGDAAAEADFFVTHFPASRAGEALCYARRYADGHLARHPKQTVTSVALLRRGPSTSDNPLPSQRFLIDVRVMVRGSKETYLGTAFCGASDGKSASCQLEGDAGPFTIKAGSDGRLLLETGSGGIGFEGDDFIHIGAAGSDDRVFLLEKSSGPMCR